MASPSFDLEVFGKELRMKRTLLFGIVTITFGLAVGVVGGELCLRLLGISYPVFVIPDSDRGYALSPGVVGINTDEARALVAINANGQRDEEHSLQKPEGTFRIAVLGDSYCEARQVDLEKAWWKVAERELNRCDAVAGTKIEVLNFGVSGYGTAQELLTLRKKVWPFAPDLVALTFTSNNDMSDNYRALRSDDTIPYFVFRDGEVTLDDSFLGSSGYQMRSSFLGRSSIWLVNHLRIAQLLNRFRYAFRQYLMSRERSDRFGDQGSDKVIYGPPVNDAWQNAWQITAALVEIFFQEVHAKGARALLISVSNPEQVYPKKNIRDDLLQRFNGTDLFYPEHRLQEIASSQQVPYIPLAPYLQKIAEDSGEDLHYFEGNDADGHWNVRGHELAGTRVASEICRLFHEGTLTLKRE